MKTGKRYKGIIVPAITPFTARYELDEKAVEKIWTLFYEFSVSPFILGTTGESASLSWELKRKYVKKATAIKKKGALLYAGISSNCTDESVDFAKFCIDNGVDALVATVPSYYVLSESQTRKFFIDLAETVKAPLVIYNIPATTHASIPLSLIDELSHHEYIVAIKDSERNGERIQRSLELWKDRKDFSYLLGWAAKSVEALIGGCDGLIPSTANLVPEIYAAMLRAVEEGNHQKAYEMQQGSDIYGRLYQEGKTLGESLWALKVLMKEKGLCESIVMPPLQPLSKEEENKLVQELHKLPG